MKEKSNQRRKKRVNDVKEKHVKIEKKWERERKY